MATSTSVNPVRGMRDFLPSELEKRKAVLELIRSTITSYGFTELETPCIEDISKLRSKQGGENESMVFEILRRGLDLSEVQSKEEAIDLGLRYDLTLPLSRYYAHNQASLPAVFRAFQTGPVWRAERPQKGRFRQFNQCDIDILGSESSASEIEVLSLGCTVLKKLGLLDRATIHLNDRRLLDHLLNACNIAPELRGSVLIELDKLDKSSIEEVRAAIAAIDGVSINSAALFMNVIGGLMNQGDVSDAALITMVFMDDSELEIPLFGVSEIMRELKRLQPEARVVFDPSLVRGMGYYTGPIYEVKLEGVGSSICGGGRYDHMIGKWLGKEVPAVGFSFGFERLIDLVDSEALLARHGVALGYRSDEEYLAAIAFRARIQESDMLAADPKISKIGLVKLPKKLKSSFFDGLLDEHYTRLVMPQYFELSFVEALDQAKKLDV